MPFTSVHKIRFDDVDGAGIVYYPRFLHLCHATFEDFFDANAPFPYPELIGARRLGFPTVHIEADFSAPLRWGDVALVQLAVTAVGRSSVNTRYRITRQADGVLTFTARITTVLMSLDSHQAQPLTDELRRVFAPEASGPD